MRALALSLIAIAATLAFPAFAENAEPIKIGDISSYTAGPSYQNPYRKGWKLAVEEINRSGGILGRPIEYVSRDDMGKPEEAIRVAQDLINREKVLWLTGAGFSSVELALSDYAKVNKVLYFPAGINSDAFIWDRHNDYAFRLGGPPPYEGNAMLAEKLKKYGPLKWVSVNPNYEWGHSNWDDFKEIIAKQIPGSSFVAAQWPETNKLKAAETIQALSAHDFNAVYLSLFGHDLLEFLREADKRGLLKDKVVVSLSAGLHDTLQSAGRSMPQGIYTFGYPSTSINSPDWHRQFIKKYIDAYGEEPDYMSMQGYVYPYFVKAALEKTGSVDAEKLRALLPGFTADTPIGHLTIRSIDRQSTMGAWIGTTAIVNDKPMLVNWSYEDAAKYFPSDEYITKRQSH